MHRNSVGLMTRWNQELTNILYPLVESYEREAITGQPLGVHSLVSEALRSRLKPKHQIKVVPIHTQETTPQSIFKALTNNRVCLELISSKEDQLSFITCIRCIPYPDGLFSTWVIVAAISVQPLFP